MRNGEGFPEEDPINGLVPFDEPGQGQDASMFDQLVNSAGSLEGAFSQRDTWHAIRFQNIRNNPLWNATFQYGDGSSQTGAQATSWTPDPIRRPGVVDSATRRIRLLDLLTIIPNSQTSYQFMQEVGFVNAAARAAEGTALAESTLQVIEQNLKMERVGHHIPISENIWRNEDQARFYVERRMPYMGRVALENYAIDMLINGATATANAAAPNEVTVTGTVAAPTNLLNHVASMLRLIEENGETEADAVALAPRQWWNMVTSQDEEGRYHIPNPFLMPTPMIWGVPVVTSTKFDNTANGFSGLAGDFAMFAELAMDPREFQVTVGTVNAQYIEDQLTLKARVYAAMANLRPKAFSRLKQPGT